MRNRNLKMGIAALCFLCAACSPPPAANFEPATEELAIRNLLLTQESAWNKGSIDEFMEGYWKSDSLRFIGNGITTGWQATLARYQKTYPDRETMGELRFEFFRFHFIADDACLVTGRYNLKRSADQPSGMFTLLMRKMSGQWVIVYDHTS